MKKTALEIPEAVQKVLTKAPEKVLKLAHTYPDDKRYIQKNYD